MEGKKSRINDDLNECLKEISELFKIIGLEETEKEEELKIVGIELNLCFTKMIEKQQNVIRELKKSLMIGYSKISELCTCLGQSFEDLDVRKLSQLSLMEQEKMVKKKIISLEKEKRDRIVIFEEIINKLEKAQKRLLGDKKNNDFKEASNDLSEKNLSHLRQELEKFNADILNREVELKSLLHSINEMLVELQAVPDFIDESNIEEETLVELRTAYGQLKAEKTERVARCKELRQNISALHLQMSDIEGIEDKVKQVKTPEDLRMLQPSSGINDKVLESLDRQLQNLVTIKTENHQRMVDNCLKKLEGLWDELHYPSNEREDSLKRMVNISLPDEEQLLSYEAEIKVLEKNAKEMRHVLNLIEERRKTKSMIEDLGKSTSDKSRLTSKSREIAAIQRKELASLSKSKNRLPKIETKLVSSLKKWREDHNEPFKFEGNPDYLEVLLRESMNEKQQKKNATLRRAQEKKRNIEDEMEIKFGTGTIRDRNLTATNNGNNDNNDVSENGNVAKRSNIGRPNQYNSLRKTKSNNESGSKITPTFIPSSIRLPMESRNVNVNVNPNPKTFERKRSAPPASSSSSSSSFMEETDIEHAISNIPRPSKRIRKN